MCKECLCCGFWRDGGGAWEAGGRMSDASQGSVGRYFEITKKRCSLWYRKRKENRYQVPGSMRGVEGKRAHMGHLLWAWEAGYSPLLKTSPLRSHRGVQRGQAACRRHHPSVSASHPPPWPIQPSKP